MLETCWETLQQVSRSKSWKPSGRFLFKSWNLTNCQNLLVGFQFKKLETHQQVSRSKAENPPLVRFQKAENLLVGFHVKELDSHHLGSQMVTYLETRWQVFSFLKSDK